MTRILRDNGYRRGPYPVTDRLLDLAHAAAMWRLRRDGSRAKGLSHSQRRALEEADWHDARAAKLRAEVWGTV